MATPLLNLFSLSLKLNEMKQNFKTSVHERIRDNYESDELSDIEFILCHEGKAETVKGQKFLFGIGSPVFKAMLYGSLAEKNSIVIEDIEPKAFKTLKKYLYTDSIAFESVDHAMSVYKTADKYDLPHLQKVTEEYISSNLQVDNIIMVLEFSRLYTNLQKICMNFIVPNIGEIITSKGFLDASLESLDKIIDQNDLMVDEIDLFNSLEEWGKYNAFKKGKRWLRKNICKS